MYMNTVVRSHWHGQVNASFLLLLEADVGRLLVESNPKPLQLLLDESLVFQRLEDIQHDEDEATRSCNGDDLPAPPLPILGPLNDARQIQQLGNGGYPN